MRVWHAVVGYLVIIMIFTIINIIGKNKKPVKKAFFSSVFGFLSLVLVNIASIFTNVTIPISLLSIAISVIGGLPGVTLMLMLNVMI